MVKDASGKEVLGDELKNCFLYSNYTSTLPDDETEYDPAMGKLEEQDNLQRFYTHLSSGRYAYRAFGYNEETKAYDIPLGGMTLQLPLEQNDVFTGENSMPTFDASLTAWMPQRRTERASARMILR